MGAAIVYSEFVSADGIIRENSKTLGLIRFEMKKGQLVSKYLVVMQT
ncbi:hypothetical protein Ct9H90mP29_11180 [bacterium]|nr:MAG: hypothetical protein Ct9H90mP29_11180 [bacterium]